MKCFLSSLCLAGLLAPLGHAHDDPFEDVHQRLQLLSRKIVKQKHFSKDDTHSDILLQFQDLNEQATSALNLLKPLKAECAAADEAVQKTWPLRRTDDVQAAELLATRFSGDYARYVELITRLARNARRVSDEVALPNPQVAQEGQALRNLASRLQRKSYDLEKGIQIKTLGPAVESLARNLGKIPLEKERTIAKRAAEIQRQATRAAIDFNNAAIAAKGLGSRLEPAAK